MLRNLNDAWGWIQRLVRRVERIESGAQLGNSSITSGRMRFIGGLLRVDSGGRVEIVGFLQVDGQTSITGPVTISGSLDITGPTRITGEFNLDGPWTIAGDGDITGDVDVTGDFEVLGGGRIKVGNVVLTPGNGGRITIGTGSSQIILDPSQFKVGPAFRMDPAHSSNGAQMEFGPDGDATIYGGPDGLMLVLNPGGNGASVQILPSVAIGVGPGVVLNGNVATPNLEPLPQGEGFETIVRSKTTGILYTFAGGTGGGPGDGIFAWSFSLDLVTSEFGMRENPATGEYALHQGIDFGMGIANIQGTPIPAAGSGTVEIAGVYAGYGNAVVINHGIDPTYDGGTHEIKTLYGHMYRAPDVSVGDTVALGQTLGGIGQTGQSFGNHLHFEVWVDGVKINPRDFMAAHGG